MLTHVLWPPRAAAFMRVSSVTDGNDRGDRRRPASPTGSDLVGLGLSIAISLVIPLLLGTLVDALAHSSPIGVVIGLLIGIAAAIATAVMQFRRYV